MKQLLAYFFLIIFSFQILPIKQIGKMLYKGQMTEEIHPAHDCDDECPDTKHKANNHTDKVFYTSGTSVAYIKYTSTVINIALHDARSVPILHITDIFAPPPNC